MYLKKINLKNKTALVTGAGKGIGLACAVALAEAGADLIIISRTQKDLDKVAKIIKKLKSKCISYACDITNYSQIKNFINKQKKIDILVNNAGTNIPEHFTKVQKKNMEYLVKLNTIATFNVAQLCTLKMLETKNRNKIGGSIINMSSQMGHVGGPIRSVYNMTKAGLEGLTKGMALDLAKSNIRVNTVCPTFVVTPMTSKFLKSKKFKNRKKIGGSIVNMSSQMGHVGGPIRSVYNMNKHGLEGLTKGMAIDLAKNNIRVNTVCPTFVVTPMTKKFLKNKKFRRDTLNNIPLGRFAEMPEISSAVVFLASDAASMITGTSLLVDGGWTAK